MTTDLGLDVDQAEAERIIESLRNGIPPVGHLRRFTVGRTTELAELDGSLDRRTASKGGALLVQANYGAGKTHLLRLIQECALDTGYVTALVTVDSNGGIRFNRMETILGAVMRALEVPGDPIPGVGSLFRAYHGADETQLPAALVSDRDEISADGRWDISDELESAGLWVALRAWGLTKKPTTRALAESWLSSPPDYNSTPGQLYRGLVEGLRPKVRDPRSDMNFYSDKVFRFDVGGHQQAWDALADVDRIAQLSGYRGLVLLFDEFEDVIQNMRNIAHEQAAFVNLFSLFQGKKFPGMAYFAVTPDFAAKCRDRLQERMVYDFPTGRFDKLSRVEMRPITKPDFRALAGRIRDVHGLAYNWSAQDAFPKSTIEPLADSLIGRRSADQVRQAITSLVSALDEAAES